MFTNDEAALIDGVIIALYPRMRQQSTRQAYRSVHAHLQAGKVGMDDLRRIQSALELYDPGQCTQSTKEGYRALTMTLLKTKVLLREAQ